MGYKCNTCGVAVENRDILYKHLKSMHPFKNKPVRETEKNITKIKCPKCDYRVISGRYTDAIDLLNEHTKSIHVW